MKQKVSVMTTGDELWSGGKLLAHGGGGTTIGEVEVIARDEINGEPIFTRNMYKNQTLVTGDVYLLEKATGYRSTYLTTPLDVVHGIHTQAEVVALQEEIGGSKFLSGEVICGVMVGIGGTTDTYNNVHAVVRTAQSVADPIPFRVVSADDDNTELRAKYFMRKTVGDKVYYYGKRFNSVTDTPGRMEVVYQDGTNVPTNPELISNTKFAKVRVVYEIVIEAEDIREYFMLDTADASTVLSRINTIGLIVGFPHIAEDGNTEYYNVRALTALNMENQELRDSKSTITFNYQYYMQ